MQNNTFPRLFVGQNIVTLKRVDSTNDFLKNELSKSAPLPDGTVILAEEQYAGRGQVKNTWSAEPGKNLTMSLLLSPTFLNPEKQFYLNKAISIAINETLSNIIGSGVKIKWPNDIYHEDYKLGGVLIENILRGSVWKYSVVGIGINVNQGKFDPSLQNPISITNILHKDYDINELLNHLCASIEKWYLQLRAGNFQQLDTEYLKSLYRLNELHHFVAHGEALVGSIKGVDESGLLEVMVSNEVRKYNFKEISFITRIEA